MKSLPVVVFIAVGIWVLLDIGYVKGQAKERSCKAIMQDITKRQLTGLAVCTKKLKFKNGKEKSKKLNCIMKCAMEGEGLVSPEGEVTYEGVDKLLLREFPPSLLERANRTFSPCIEVALGKLDPNPETDPFCKTYDPVIKCLIGVLPNLCPKD